MGYCIYCGRAAGWLKDRHPECEEKEIERKNEQKKCKNDMIALAQNAALGLTTHNDLKGELRALALGKGVQEEYVRTALIAGWEAAVRNFLEDGNLDPQEDERIALFQREYSLSQDELDRSGYLTKALRAGILRDVMEGRISTRLNFGDRLPFNLQKNEHPVYAFGDVDLLEDRTRREYVGRSHGVSMRIARGLYYRVGEFHGTPIDRTERVHVDTGIFLVTDYHLYFGGSSKSFRIPYRKIVSFTPFDDGIGVHRDAATAKPQIFVTGDGWFTYNLVINMTKSD